MEAPRDRALRMTSLASPSVLPSAMSAHRVVEREGGGRDTVAEFFAGLGLGQADLRGLPATVLRSRPVSQAVRALVPCS